MKKIILSISLLVLTVLTFSAVTVSASRVGIQVVDSFRGSPGEVLIGHTSDSGHKYIQYSGQIYGGKTLDHLHITAPHYNPVMYRLADSNRDPLSFQSVELRSHVDMHTTHDDSDPPNNLKFIIRGHTIKLYTEHNTLFFIDFDGKPVKIADRDSEGIFKAMVLSTGPNRVLVRISWIGNPNHPENEVQLRRVSLPVKDKNVYVDFGGGGGTPFNTAAEVHWLEVDEILRGSRR